MEAEHARKRSLVNAERVRVASELAIANALVDVDSGTEPLQGRIEITARLQRDAVDKSIAEASGLGRSAVRHRYSERISASRRSSEEVAFIEAIADATSLVVVESLQADGFEVSTSTSEERDYRGSNDAPPEYYDTYFSVAW